MTTATIPKERTIAVDVGIDTIRVVIKTDFNTTQLKQAIIDQCIRDKERMKEKRNFEELQKTLGFDVIVSEGCCLVTDDLIERVIPFLFPPSL